MVKRMESERIYCIAIHRPRMPTPAQTPTPHEPHNRPRPVVVVRLSNWIGDVVLMLPALVRLSRIADLQLVGRRWAPDLLAAYGWPCHVYPAKLKERVRLLRSLKQPGVPAHGLCVPTSFSSALEFRLAGLPASGMDHADHGEFFNGVESAQCGFGADDGERLAVNGIAITLVGVLHGSFLVLKRAQRSPSSLARSARPNPRWLGALAAVPS